jgi:hypothetical protein
MRKSIAVNETARKQGKPSFQQTNSYVFALDGTSLK